ncbi:MAG: phenylalanine--tRNA ligase subunit beta [Patescibacteria group bacterium]
MIVSKQWLSEYISLPESVDAEKLAHDLTMATVEVEEVIDQAAQYDKMVVGKIVELTKHPNADKLQLAHTDIGDEKVQIVCGGTNLFEGMLVAVALPGAKVRWHGEGDLITLEPAKIRGEKSHGMICASAEIGLGDMFPSDDEREIINLSALNVAAGTPIAEALSLDDVLIEIDNKSLTNRPDLWCHHGIARELAALYDIPLQEPKVYALEQQRKSDIKISIKADACFGFNVLRIDTDTKSETPDWMKKRLQACGLRPISFAVDLTNYVMHDVGEPMHAFDVDTITDKTFVVRQAKDGESLMLLGNEHIELTGRDMVVADGKQPLALAGVKGGEMSGVTDNTTSFAFEAATFDAITVRRMSTHHSVRTDASMRHEKGLDTDRAPLALARLAQLFSDIDSTATIHGFISEQPKATEKNEVTVTHEFIINRIGQDIAPEKVTSILNKLGFTVQEKKGTYNITVPTWRSTGDVSIPEDIVEEVARQFGYDNLERFDPQVTLTNAVLQPPYITERSIKEALAYSTGLHEVFSYPWTTDEYVRLFGFAPDTLVGLECPPAENQGYLQPSLIPNMLPILEKNITEKSDFGLFQVARVFSTADDSQFSHDGESLPEQKKMLCIALTSKSEQELIRDLKGMIDMLSEVTGNKISYDYTAEVPAYFSSMQSAKLSLDDDSVGAVGFLNTKITKSMSLRDSYACFAEIDLDVLLQEKVDAVQFSPLPQYPGTERDVAIEVSKDVAWKDIADIVEHSSPLLKTVDVFDVYEGKHIASDKKSIAFRLYFASDERTLESVEVDDVVEEIVHKLEHAIGAQLRS